MTFYTKYRPQTWDEVAGQGHITRTLMNALENSEVAHALLFAGKHGTGKTTVARILAKELGAIGSDVVEIDAASNRGIDDARRLKEATFFVPLNGPVKVFILDEVQMLTKEANNALLKTLEEPPPGVYFVLCTTNPQKLIPTVLSRCQRHNFHSISKKDIVGRLRYICRVEKIDFDHQALSLIANQAQGSMRDAISMLDLFSNYGYIGVEKVKEVLGLADRRLIEKMLDGLADEDIQKCLETVSEVWGSGTALDAYCKQMTEYLRALLLVELGQPDPLYSIDKSFKGRFKTIGLRYAVGVWNGARLNVHKCALPTLELECAAIDCIEYGVSDEAGDF